MEFHPSLSNVDIKQLTNCRWGMMLWQLLVTSFFIYSYRQYGNNFAMFINFMIQTYYIAKFFYWEIGYFYTLDIILDRAGFYICWGCIAFVPSLYT